MAKAKKKEQKKKDPKVRLPNAWSSKKSKDGTGRGGGAGGKLNTEQVLQQMSQLLLKQL